MANHNGTRGRTTADKTEAAAQNLRTEKNRIKFGRRDGDRPAAAGDMELNLWVPPGTIPEGYVGLWVTDDEKGSVQRKIEEWWGHVTDEEGVNIRRRSGSGYVYLMAIEEKYKKEIDDLRSQRYRDSIGENDRADLGVNGVESYTPNGERNNLRVRKDPFA